MQNLPNIESGEDQQTLMTTIWLDSIGVVLAFHVLDTSDTVPGLPKIKDLLERSGARSQAFASAFVTWRDFECHRIGVNLDFVGSDGILVPIVLHRQRQASQPAGHGCSFLAFVKEGVVIAVAQGLVHRNSADCSKDVLQEACHLPMASCIADLAGVDSRPSRTQY